MATISSNDVLLNQTVSKEAANSDNLSITKNIACCSVIHGFAKKISKTTSVCCLPIYEIRRHSQKSSNRCQWKECPLHI